MQKLLETIIDEFFKNTDYLRPSLLSLLILVFLIFIIKKSASFPFYYKASITVFSVGAVILLYNYFAWKLLLLYYIAAAISVISLISAMIIFFINQFKLGRVISKANGQSVGYTENAALLQLKSISQKRLTPRQNMKYTKYKLYISVRLGSLRSADKLLKEIVNEKNYRIGQAYYSLLQYIVLFNSGNMAGADDEIKKAEDHKNKDTDPLIQTEISLNRGVSYVTMRNYQAADDCFRRAVSEYRHFRIKDSSLLYLIYYNLAFNKTRIGSAEESMAVVEEYKSMLRTGKFNEKINYFNLKLEIMRQLNTSRELIDEFVQSAFTQFISCKLPIKSKVIFAGSMMRIVWSGMLNPEPGLKLLQDNLSVIDTVAPMTRFRIFTDLFYLFGDLQGKIRNRFKKLIEATEAYRAAQAECDLETHRKSLPAEAVYDRCNCYKELASLKKGNGNEGSRFSPVDFLSNAVNLYHENGLYVDEQLLRLDIVDELCAAEHLDADFRPRDRALIQEQLSVAEAFLPKLEKHPALGEFNLRLSFYHLILDEYGLCAEYYVKFGEAMLSLSHFTPWIHRYRMITAFSTRIIYCKKIIEELRGSSDIFGCSQAAREWFKSFPNHDGILDSVLLAKFIGCSTEACPLKFKLWCDSGQASPCVHAWLFFRELNLNADITYCQFTDEPDKDLMFFSCSRHPFEADKSLTLSRASANTGISFKGTTLNPFNLSELPPEQINLFNEIYNIICSHTPDGCPTINELARLFTSTMRPVPGI